MKKPAETGNKPLGKPPGRKKANKLVRSKMMAIAKFKERNPNISLISIAEEFNCTYNQVLNAIRKYKAGQLHKSKPVRKAKIEEAIKLSPEDLFLRQFHKSLAGLEVEKDIGVQERIMLLERLAQIRKINQHIKIESHLKKQDAGVIAMIVRRYLPDASDEDVIKIYYEELTKWKNSQQ